jgi:hypothetical protein
VTATPFCHLCNRPIIGLPFQEEIPLGSIQKKRRGFRKLKRYWNLVGDSGGDVKSNEVVPSDLEFFFAFDHLAREFGYEILKPKDNKPPA